MRGLDVRTGGMKDGMSLWGVGEDTEVYPSLPAHKENQRYRSY